MSPPKWVAPMIDLDPAWSPDGTMLAFYHFGIVSIDYRTTDFEADPDSEGVWLVTPEGKNKRLIVKSARSPAWSPEGRWIGFVMPDGQIWKSRSTGDSLVQLTSRGTNSFPSWSPDGSWIASSSAVCEDDHPCGVWLTKPDGSQSFLITELGDRPDWHPNGETLVFAGRLDGKIGIVSFNISNFTKHMLLDLSATGLSAGPKYSPDGSKIAFGRDFHIWIVGSGRVADLKQLTGHSNVGEISWSPDGTRIAYAERQGLWIIDADGTDAHQITFPPN